MPSQQASPALPPAPSARAVHAGMVQRAASGVAIVAGVATLAGWLLDVQRLTDWFGDGISMLFNAGLCTLTSGAALLLLTSVRSAWAVPAGRLLALAPILIGGLTLLEHVTGAGLGVDIAITTEWGQNRTMAPGRIGVPASVSFVLLGVSLLLLSVHGPASRFAGVVALAPLVIASVSFTGYWFGADQLFGLAQITAVARQSSFAIAVLSLGVMAAQPEHGLYLALTRNDTGGRVFRQMIVPILLIPLFVGWLLMVGHGMGLYDTAFSAALLVITEVLLFVAVLWWTAQRLSQFAGRAQQASEHLAAVIESSHDAIISKTLEGVIQSWNDGARQTFGYTAEEAVGRSILMVVPPDRVEEEQDILARLRRGERIDDFVTVRVRKDGQPIEVSLSVSPVRDDSRLIVGASTIARDITHRRRVDEAIRRSEADLRALADSIPQLAWMAHPNGDIFWYNLRWHEYTGRGLEEMSGWGWQAVHDPQILPMVLARWKHCLASGTFFEMEFPLKGADGEFRWFLTRVHPLRDESGKVVRWFGTNTDIDRAKRVEAQLREQADTLELLNQSATTVGATLELQELLQTVTDIATRLSGAKFGAFFYNTTDDDGEAYLLYTLSGAPREAFDKFGQPRATPLFGPTFRGEGLIRSDDILEDPAYGHVAPHFGMPEGHLPVRSYLAVPVSTHKGEVLGGLFFGHPEVGVFNEQTERLISGVATQASVALDNARLYEDLREAAEVRLRLLEAERAARSHAERVNVMKDEFLATLSHELRTPLNAILGWAQILDPNDSDAEELAEGLEAIERNARAQTQLIEDLLDMSRIISGKIRLNVEAIRLADAVRQAAQSVQHSADAKQIHLALNLGDGSAEVIGDPTRMQQVFWNLLSNAIKFTPRGGEVLVDIAGHDSHLEVTVADNGIGIKPEFLPLVFDRFRQADSSTTRAYGGLGLGLSIVKNLVELHGGWVEVRSDGEGQGAAFVVRLPVATLSRDADRDNQPPDAQPPLESMRLGGVRVVVVDDEPDARALLLRLLTQQDAEVFAASSADEGLRLIRERLPDVIVSDIGMPGVDGYQFIDSVRRLPQSEGGEIPAIALTALARSEDRARALRAGFQLHVSKPIQPRQLVASIHSLVDHEE